MVVAPPLAFELFTESAPEHVPLRIHILTATMSCIAPTPPPATTLPHGPHTDSMESASAIVGRFDKASRSRKRVGALLGMQQAVIALRNTAQAIRKAGIYDITHDTLLQWSSAVLDKSEILEEEIQALSALEETGDEPVTDRERPHQARGGFAVSSTTRRHGGNLMVDSAPRVISHHQLMTSSLYVALEGVANDLRAERAIMFQYQSSTDEMIGVGAVGFSNSGFRPQEFRASASVGLTGAVCATGVGLNVSNAYSDSGFDISLDKKTKYRTYDLLVFPIRSPKTRAVVGVVQVINKNRGSVPFDDEDERRLNTYCGLLSYILLHYPADFVANYFDPKPLHSIVPFKALSGQEALLPPVAQKSSSGPQLVFRTLHSGKTFKKKNINMEKVDPVLPDSSKSLREVDEHISKLEECWANSVRMNIELQDDKEFTIRQMRQLREEYRHRPSRKSKTNRPETDLHDLRANPLLNAPENLMTEHFASLKAELRAVLAGTEQWQSLTDNAATTM